MQHQSYHMSSGHTEGPSWIVWKMVLNCMLQLCFCCICILDHYTYNVKLCFLQHMTFKKKTKIELVYWHVIDFPLGYHTLQMRRLSSEYDRHTNIYFKECSNSFFEWNTKVALYKSKRYMVPVILLWTTSLWN